MSADNINPLFYTTSSLRKRGENMIRDTSSALAELIKNAYDADAGNVRIVIDTLHKPSHPAFHTEPTEDGFMYMEDDGIGVSYKDLQRWNDFSVSSKKIDGGKIITTKRSPAGGQGKGRLGMMKLGHRVELFTHSTQTGEHSHLAFDWTQLSEKKLMQETEIFLEAINDTGSAGTSLFIFPLVEKQYWTIANWQTILEDTTNNVFPFLDKNGFRVTLSLNGQEIELGAHRVKPGDHRVRIEHVWQNHSVELKNEVIAFWNRNKTIRTDFPFEERAKQVVIVLRSEADHNIVGLSTAELVTFKQLNNNNFYLYRTIILPAYRHPGLSVKMTIETRDVLERYALMSRSSAKGLIAFIENPRVQQYMRQAILPGSNMAFIGTDKSGRHIRVYYFKGATI